MHKSAKKNNSSESAIPNLAPRWHRKDGAIIFTLPPTDGMDGFRRIGRLEGRGVCVGESARSVLISSHFKPTKNITTKIAVLEGKLFKDSERIMENIRAEANSRRLTKTNAEDACLIWEMFTYAEIKEMGLQRIISMHEPIKDYDGDFSHLSVCRLRSGGWLLSSYDKPGFRWSSDCGFAFAVSQTTV